MFFSSCSAMVAQDLCDVCSDDTAKKCLTCMASNYGTRERDHYTSPDLERHQRQHLQHQSLCYIHHRQLEFYCVTDQLAICSHCLLYNHIGHYVIEQVINQSGSSVQIFSTFKVNLLLVLYR